MAMIIMRIEVTGQILFKRRKFHRNLSFHIVIKVKLWRRFLEMN